MFPRNGPCTLPALVLVRRLKLCFCAALALFWPIPSLGSSRTYICFFDPHSSEVDARCKDTVEAFWRALEDVKTNPQNPYGLIREGFGAWRIEVIGHAQEEPIAEENDTLSLRRATAVADELKRIGIPSHLITAVGRGAREELIPNQPFDKGNTWTAIVIRGAQRS